MTGFGERLKQARQQARMSQTQLAGDELSPSYVSLLESGKRQPSPDVVRLLAKRLGTTVESLLGEQSDGDRRIVELELAYARLAINHGEAESARARLVALLDGPGLDRASRDDAIWLLASAEDKLNNLEGAVRLLLPLFERCLRGESSVPLAHVAMNLCHHYLDCGDLHAAVRVGERGLEAIRAQGLEGTDEHLRLAATLMNAYFEQGDFAHCTSWAEQLIVLAEERGTPRGQSAIYWNAALVAESQGKVAEALHLSSRALALVTELGSERDLPRLRVVAAWFLLRSTPPRPEEAARILDGALTELRDLGSHIDLADWERVRALAELQLGHPRSAERLAREALLHLSNHPGLESAQTLTTLGDALVAQGRRDEAAQHYLAAQETLTGLKPSRRLAAPLRELGARLELLGDTQLALHAYRNALNAANVPGVDSAAQLAFAAGATVAPSTAAAAGEEPYVPSAFAPGEIEDGRVWRTHDDRSAERQEEGQEAPHGM